MRNVKKQRKISSPFNLIAVREVEILKENKNKFMFSHLHVVPNRIISYFIGIMYGN